MNISAAKFLSAAAAKQAKIVHFGSKVQVGKPSKIKSSLKSKIYGELGSDSFAQTDLVALAKVAYGKESSLDEQVEKFADLLAAAFGTDVNSDDVESIELGDEKACLVAKINID